MQINFEDIFDKTIEAALWVYLVVTIVFSVAVFWGPILETPKFAPGSPVGYPGGKSLPETPKAPLQTPCKTQIEANPLEGNPSCSLSSPKRTFLFQNFRAHARFLFNS